MSLKEGIITDLLRIRHKHDFFEAQAICYWHGQCIGEGSIMDGYAIIENMKLPGFIAYEIKTSRSDFKSDKKWWKYLTLCDQFYFVCPFGMIKANELPDEAGLIYVTKNGKRLRKVKDSFKTLGNRNKIVHVLRHILTRRIIKGDQQ